MHELLRVTPLVVLIAAGGCKAIIGWEEATVTSTSTGSSAGGGGGGGGPAAPTCDDSRKNGEETGKDCGGSCSPCPLGEGCKTGSDCQSKMCSTGGICGTASCEDQAQNGDESDVDCGGQACGPCAFGKACVTGGDCVTGSCNDKKCDAEILVSGLTSPNSLAVDDTNVYWADTDLGAIMMADLATGTPMEVATGLLDPQRLVGAGIELTDLSSSGLHWVEPGAGRVGEANVSPMFGPVVGETITGVNPRAVLPDGLYWTNQAAPATTPKGSIMTHDLANPTLAVDFIKLGGQPDRFVDAGATNRFVFSMDVYGAPGVWTVEATYTSTATQVVADVVVAGLAADAAFAYWSDGLPSGSVAKASLTGGTPIVIASGQANPTDVATDALHIFWVNQGAGAGSGQLMKAPLAGGAPVVLASGQENPRGLVLFKSDVYWASGAPGQGRVNRLPK